VGGRPQQERSFVPRREKKRSNIYKRKSEGLHLQKKKGSALVFSSREKGGGGAVREKRDGRHALAKAAWKLRFWIKPVGGGEGKARATASGFQVASWGKKKKVFYGGVDDARGTVLGLGGRQSSSIVATSAGMKEGAVRVFLGGKNFWNISADESLFKRKEKRKGSHNLKGERKKGPHFLPSRRRKKERKKKKGVCGTTLFWLMTEATNVFPSRREKNRERHRAMGKKRVCFLCSEGGGKKWGPEKNDSPKQVKMISSDMIKGKRGGGAREENMPMPKKLSEKLFVSTEGKGGKEKGTY